MSTIKRWFSALALAAGLALASSAQAALLWSNGVGDGNIGGYCASCGPAGAYTMMDDFSLSSGQANLLVEWDASWFNILPTGSAGSDIIISIWQNKNANLLWTQTFDFQQLTLVSVNATSGSNANLTMQSTLLGVNLLPGTYWLSFSGDNHHFTTTGGGSAIQVYSSNLGTGYDPNQNLPMPFRLYTAAEVPEPGLALLLGLGLLGLGFARRQRG